MKQDNTKEKHNHAHLFKIVCSLSTIALFTKIFGFAEKFVIAHFYGTGDTADVYFAATGIILSVVWIIRELLYPSFLPVLVESFSESKTISGNLFKKVFLSSAIILAVIAAILFLFSNFIVKVLLPGYIGDKQLLTANLLRTLSPAMFFIGLTMVTYITLNAGKHFLKAACPEAALKLFIVIGLTILIPFKGIYSLPIVLGIGSLGCLLVQLYFIPERKFLFKPKDTSNYAAYHKKILLLMSPIVLGVVFSHISGLIDNMLASKLESGYLSYLAYSKKLIDAVLLIGPVAMVTVIYSHLSHLAVDKDYDKFKTLVINSLRIIFYLSIPLACVLIILRQPIIQFLFQRGDFTTESTIGTSQAFMIYAFGLTTLSLETLFVFTFFALSDTKTPVFYGILCVILDIILAIVLMGPFKHLGIAGAFVISKTVKIVILGAILNKRISGIFNSQTALLLLKLGVITSMIGISMKLLLAIQNGTSSLNILAFDLMLPSIGAFVIFIVGSHLLNIKEYKLTIDLIKYRKAAVSELYGETK